MLPSAMRMIQKLYFHSNEHVPQDVTHQCHFVDRKHSDLWAYIYLVVSLCGSESLKGWKPVGVRGIQRSYSWRPFKLFTATSIWEQLLAAAYEYFSFCCVSQRPSCLLPQPERHYYDNSSICTSLNSQRLPAKRAQCMQNFDVKHNNHSPKQVKLAKKKAAAVPGFCVPTRLRA